jgi:hypothetical protein
LPAKYGDAEALTISVAPAVASSDSGGPGTQMSSHTVSPTRTPDRSTIAPFSPAWKYRCSSKTP